jgi:hypothetical protein
MGGGGAAQLAAQNDVDFLEGLCHNIGGISNGLPEAAILPTGQQWHGGLTRFERISSYAESKTLSKTLRRQSHPLRVAVFFAVLRGALEKTHYEYVHRPEPARESSRRQFKRHIKQLCPFE